MLNTLVYDALVYNGSQWAVYNRSVQHDPLRALVNKLIVYKGVMVNPREHKQNTCSLL